MKYQVRELFFVQSYGIPAGTFLDANGNGPWDAVVKGRPPPPTAIALDDEASEAMHRLYSPERILVADGVRKYPELFRSDRTNPAVPDSVP